MDLQGRSRHYQVIVDAGPPGSRARWQFIRDSSGKSGVREDRIEVRSKRFADGYALELRLPWANLGVTGARGFRCGLQVEFTHPRGAPGKGESRQFLVWYPKTGAHKDTSLCHTLELSAAPSQAAKVAIAKDFNKNERFMVGIAAGAEAQGKEVRILAGKGGKVLARSPLGRRGTESQALLQINLPEENTFRHPWKILIEDQEVGSLEPPAAAEFKFRTVKKIHLGFDAYQFDNPHFPDFHIDGADSLGMDVKSFSVRKTFFDTRYRKVEGADAPGRYGAIVEVRGPSGIAIRRYFTLCRISRDGMRDSATPGGALEAAASADSVSGYPWSQVRPMASIRRDPEQIDRLWWNGLTARLSGKARVDSRAPLGLPKRLSARAYPTLKPTPHSDARPLTELKDLGRQWAETSGIAFSLCFSVDGQIVLDTAFGEMKRGDARTLASVTKFLQALLIVMAADQGRIDLDAGIERYLPRFRIKAVPNRPRLTLRHLLTQTSGLLNDWGVSWGLNSEEELAELLPAARIGREYRNANHNFVLAGRVLESVTGQLAEEHFVNCLFEPLGLEQASPAAPGDLASMTALDLAKIGQMVLNGGGYGKYRFFRKEFNKQIRPHNLEAILGPGSKTVGGLGIGPMVDEEFGKEAFGLYSGSGSFLIIDPARKVVLALVRNKQGDQYGAYRRRIQRAVMKEVSGP